MFSRMIAARLSCPSKTTWTPGLPSPTRCSRSFLPVAVSQAEAVCRLTTTSVRPLGLSAAAVGSAFMPPGQRQNAVCRSVGTS
ncbi:hypothetical protein [Nonomuraea salmonea]|uniref:hypothetical protein n=1 Tax=Nonomuraea salmonea TaxID=46181 RepID=UPI002FEB8D16